MVELRRVANACLAVCLASFALTVFSYALDLKPGCPCTDWEVCCFKDENACGEDRCLCQDVLTYDEDQENSSYCTNQSAIPSGSLAFWIGYICSIVFVLSLKLGIVLHIVACFTNCQSQENAAVELPISSKTYPREQSKETDHLLS